MTRRLLNPQFAARATHVALAVIIAFLGLSVTVSSPAAAEDDGPFGVCADCHDTIAAQFSHNPHVAIARAEKGKNVCESCHANGEKHAEEADPSLIGIPKGVDSNRICAGCHANVANTGMGSENHAAAGVGCVNCHDPHSQDLHAQPLLRAKVGELCVSCHPSQAAQFRKPFAHKLGRGDMSCVSCHNPHGGRGEDSLKGAERAEIVCVTCHSDVRGPFVFSHANDTVGNCMTCHEPHGSNNSRRLVRSTVSQLCLECHSTLTSATLGSQPPSFHDLRSPRYRECTTCHVAIHGSNSSPALLR